MQNDVKAAVPPAVLRRLTLAVTVLTGLVAVVAVAAIVLTALFGGEGESTAELVLIGAAMLAIVLHATALRHLLLRGGHQRFVRVGVLLGGIALLAVSGAAVVGAALDDSPGGALGGLLLAVQGGAAVLTVAFPQLVTERTA
jgi:hypothetical protein